MVITANTSSEKFKSDNITDGLRLCVKSLEKRHRDDGTDEDDSIHDSDEDDSIHDSDEDEDEDDGDEDGENEDEDEDEAEAEAEAEDAWGEEDENDLPWLAVSPR